MELDKCDLDAARAAFEAQGMAEERWSHILGIFRRLDDGDCQGYMIHCSARTANVLRAVLAARGA